MYRVFDKHHGLVDVEVFSGSGGCKVRKNDSLRGSEPTAASGSCTAALLLTEGRRGRPKPDARHRRSRKPPGRRKQSALSRGSTPPSATHSPPLAARQLRGGSSGSVSAAAPASIGAARCWPARPGAATLAPRDRRCAGGGGARAPAGTAPQQPRGGVMRGVRAVASERTFKGRLVRLPCHDGGLARSLLKANAEGATEG